MGIALLVLALVGLGCLVARGNPMGTLALGPVVVACSAAVAHLMPIGIRFDTWFFPALAVACAAAIDEVARRVPLGVQLLGVVLAMVVVVRMVNNASYPEFRPSYRSVAVAARAVPADECVVLDGVQLAQWAWDTKWDISILGQVPRETWIVVGFPGRCVSAPEYGPEWTASDVLHTSDPPGDRVWWINRTGAARAGLPQTLRLVRETDFDGWTLAELARR